MGLSWPTTGPPGWVTGALCNEAGENPLNTLFHEVAHISLHEAGLGVEQQTGRSEFVLNRIAIVMAEAYEYDNKTRKKKPRR